MSEREAYGRACEAFRAAHAQLLLQWRALPDRVALRPPAELLADLMALGGFDVDGSTVAGGGGLAPDPFDVSFWNRDPNDRDLP